MDIVLIILVAFGASALTFFSGFGLGTLLLPAFALFLATPAAVAATAIVHLLNGLFKGTLVWKTAHWPTVLKFGIPAVPGAILGAWMLGMLGHRTAYSWTAFDHEWTSSVANILIGGLLILLAILEMTPRFRTLKASPRLLPAGGAITGFIGGLTGQQGALRSIFLLRTGLPAPQFIATGVLVSIFIDLSRVPTYLAVLSDPSSDLGGDDVGLIAVGTLAAFAGAWLGSRYLRKARIEMIHKTVAGLLLAIGIALILGLTGTQA